MVYNRTTILRYPIKYIVDILLKSTVFEESVERSMSAYSWLSTIVLSNLQPEVYRLYLFYFFYFSRVPLYFERQQNTTYLSESEIVYPKWFSIERLDCHETSVWLNQPISDRMCGITR